jgi:hypothetical protein
MKNFYLLFLLCFKIGYGQGIENYKSLDATQPIYFGGNFIVFNGDTTQLNDYNFFIDARLTDAITEKYNHVYNSVQKAAAHLKNGTEDKPMQLHIAPYVYWIDNPDDTAIRTGENGQPPFGLIIKCEWLKFNGLNSNAENTVLACNRGQTIGARGNFTMFRFYGQGTAADNITFGNYCNVDLNYKLMSALSRKKRATAIVQAQLIICDGDKIFANNCRFISRLNLCPFVGGKRVLFNNCHFESTDDALCGTGVYLNSTLDFYSGKPFFRTSGTGAVFLNCNITSFVNGEQFFTKANGQVTVIDTKIKTPAGTYIGWRDVVPAETRNYEHNNYQNEKLLAIGAKNNSSTVSLQNKKLLNAYKINGIYNTYNLLQGPDDWDPMQIKNKVLDAEKTDNTKYTNLPVQMLVTPTRVSIETNKTDITLNAKQYRFGNYETNGEKINWQIENGNNDLATLQISSDGMSCKVMPTNKLSATKDIVVRASTASGLQAASVITVAPAILAAPGFATKPAITYNTKGQLQLSYKLKENYKDESIINWYRCSNTNGDNALEVAVSRNNDPLKNYTLTAGDKGYYIMAAIQPKHIRSDTGMPVKLVYAKPVTVAAIKTKLNILETDFKNTSTKNQPEIIPGFFTWAHLQAVETERRFAVDNTRDAWYYSTGSEGAADIKGVMQGRNGKMCYTPVGNSFGNMQLTIQAAPFKSAGQGFSVAPLYMDITIKMDNKTMTGYALRLIRTTKFHDAVDVYFVEYKNGVATQIGEAVSTTVFRTICTIKIVADNNTLQAILTTTAEPHSNSNNELKPTVNLSTNYTTNNNGGIGVEFRGGSPVVFNYLKAEWKP